MSQGGEMYWINFFCKVLTDKKEYVLLDNKKDGGLIPK